MHISRGKARYIGYGIGEVGGGRGRGGERGTLRTTTTFIQQTETDRQNGVRQLSREKKHIPLVRSCVRSFLGSLVP